MPRYQSIRNNFRPTSLVPKPYGWTGMPGYNRYDVPVNLIDAQTGLTTEGTRQALAYEWLDSQQMGGDRSLSNPPFTSGASGRIPPMLMEGFTGEGQPRILRGFIRRAQYEAGDPLSKARLYFMYNPTDITREYVSYLDQQALDPFNTVFQSGNLVAPPSFMNFRFNLFFDRQTETVDPNHPGVFVDYQFFDLVVRNVIPTDPNSSSNQLPDNGVMMVNPRDITVIFSPQLTVQGRPINAQVSFEKFTHRMTPIRMSISLEMRVMYFGPLLDQTEYRMQQSEFTSEVSVPTEEAFNFDLTFTSIVKEDDPVEGLDNVNDLVGLSVTQPPHAGRPDAFGWGSGWPHCSADKMVSLVVDGVNYGQCRAEVKELLTLLLKQTRRSGYNPRQGVCSCYNCRDMNPKRNPPVPSNHSWGLAIDINSDRNPYRSSLVTDMPDWMPPMWQTFGWYWGGNWKGSKDAMHYEFKGTPQDASQYTKLARAHIAP